MADIWSKTKRSQVMSRIRGKNTKPEVLVRRLLRQLGLKYRLHPKALPGKPDIVLPEYKLAIFVHGCFWHFHGRCREGRIPLTRRGYWEPKLLGNRKRDAQKRRILKRQGWKVMTLWECQVEKQPMLIIRKIGKHLKTEGLKNAKP